MACTVTPQVNSNFFVGAGTGLIWAWKQAKLHGLDMVSNWQYNIPNKVYNFVYCSESSQLISYMYSYLDLFAVYSRILADAILTGSMDMLPQLNYGFPLISPQKLFCKC